MSEPAARRVRPAAPGPQPVEPRPVVPADVPAPVDSGVSSGQVGSLLRTESLTRHF
jgi:hypothetical protein